jgi:hypothetical protein
MDLAYEDRATIKPEGCEAEFHTPSGSEMALLAAARDTAPINRLA